MTRPEPVAPEDLVDCLVCNGSGVVQEPHDGGTHPVHCPCTYRRPCDLLCRCSGGPM